MLAPDSDVYYSRTVTALLDTSHGPADGSAWVHSVETLDIPVAEDPADCQHYDTVCPSCFGSWATDYVFLDRVPGVDA